MRVLENACVVNRHGMHVHDLETVFPAGLRQHGKIPAPLPAETEIIADHEITHLQTVHQQALDELFGLERGEFGVELQAQHAIHRVAAQRLELLAQARQARNGGLRLKEFLRLRLEQNHLGGQAEFLAFFRQLADHRLVTEMNAVEISDRGDTPAMLRLEVVPPAYELHGTAQIYARENREGYRLARARTSEKQREIYRCAQSGSSSSMMSCSGRRPPKPS
jgi:hypothetical protein